MSQMNGDPLALSGGTPEPRGLSLDQRGVRTNDRRAISRPARASTT